MLKAITTAISVAQKAASGADDIARVTKLATAPMDEVGKLAHTASKADDGAKLAPHLTQDAIEVGGGLADNGWAQQNQLRDLAKKPSKGQPRATKPDLSEGSEAINASSSFSGSEPTSRRTLGLSGVASKSAPASQSHLVMIKKGMEAMDEIAPGVRQRLDQLLAPEVDPKIDGQLQATSQKLSDLLGGQAKLLNTPDHRLDSAARQQKAEVLAQQDQLTSLYDQLELKKAEVERKQVAQATDLAGTFLRRMRHSQPHEDVGAGMALDGKASAQLAKDGISTQEVGQWFQQFHHQTGLPTPEKPINITYQKDRAHYFNPSDELNVGAKLNRRIMLHEMAHRLEYRSPEISQANKQWVAARSSQAGFDETAPLKDLVPKSKYGADEMARPDHFINPYVGKVYPDSATEVLSVGLEHLADDKNFVRLYRQDSEHLFLVLGALKTAQEQFKQGGGW